MSKVEIFLESEKHAEKIGELEEELYEVVMSAIEEYAEKHNLKVTERTIEDE